MGNNTFKLTSQCIKYSCNFYNLSCPYEIHHSFLTGLLTNYSIIKVFSNKHKDLKSNQAFKEI